MSLEVRTATESEYADWTHAVTTGFLRAAPKPPEVVAARLAATDLSRTLGAVEDGRWVATFRSFPQELTVPGGAVVAADAISAVTVTPTHRRRGLLNRMMARDLAAAKERGDTVATLIAAEYPIYGRYGFGSAAPGAERVVDVPRAGLDPRWSGPDDGGRVDLVDVAEVRRLGPEFHDRWRLLQPGAIDRSARWWRVNTGEEPDDEPFRHRFYAVYRAGTGEVQGLAAYEVDDDWGGSKQPLNTATVRQLHGMNATAERALWLYLCSIDWVMRVRTGRRALDDLLPDFLPDARAARLESVADFLWVRLLDTARALEARTYGASDALVLDVVDAGGFAGGRFRVEGGPDGATCTATTSSPDLTIQARDLASLYLGAGTPARLAALGRLAEHTAGATVRAEAFFHTPRSPWCQDIF